MLKTDLPLPDASLTLFTSVWDSSESTTLLQTLQDTLAWRQKNIRLFGRDVMQPRLVCWYGDDGADYRYSGVSNQALPWTPELLEIKAKVESTCQIRCNAVLGNCYRNGQDSVSWHSDDEPELGSMPIIASVSLGAVRRFELRHKKRPEYRLKLDLPDASILLMAGQTQANYRHALPKQGSVQDVRINLTFRLIYPV